MSHCEDFGRIGLLADNKKTQAMWKQLSQDQQEVKINVPDVLSGRS